MFHGVRELSDQSLLNMMTYPSVKNRRNNYSSGDADEATTNIQTGEISQAKAVRKYGIRLQTLAQKYRNKIENVAENRTGSISVL